MKSKVAALVTTQWLKSQLGTKSKLKLLDASWTVQHGGPEQYFTKHIPGALFFDQNRCVKPRPTCAVGFPEPQCFQKYIRGLGVNMDDHLVVYDRGNLVASARAWWTLRAMGHPSVSVLNGGLMQWENGGEPTQMGDPSNDVKDGDFELQLKDNLICRFKDMAAIAESGSSQVLDGRGRSDYLGEGEEPSNATKTALESFNMPLPPTMNKGHIRGAIHCPLGPFKDKETGLVRSKDELKQIFENVGTRWDWPITTLCYNGNNASFLALCAAEAGRDDAAVYYGSWTEFGQLADSKLCAVGQESRKQG